MKTLEEKAKAYDKAIAKAQKELQTCGSTDCDAARQIYRFFPELSESEDERIRKSIIAIINNYVDNSNTFKPKMLAWLEKQGKEDSSIQQAYKHGYIEGQRIERKCWLEKQGEQKPKWTDEDEERLRSCIIELQGKGLMGGVDTMDSKWLKSLKQRMEEQEPKPKVKYAGNEYNVLEVKDIAGVMFYGIEDEPNHIDYVKAENCEIISCYTIKENGSPYPTKPAVFSEKKPKRMISAEAKEAMYDKPTCVGRNDTLLDLLHKMPYHITVDGIEYHFVLKKTGVYTAYYEGEGSDMGIFGMTAFSPIDLLTEMLEKLKKKGLLE